MWSYTTLTAIATGLGVCRYVGVGAPQWASAGSGCFYMLLMLDLLPHFWGVWLATV